ncbi:MAG: class IIb bacteriocin, lactobin A/cerein 7B family [Flavobacteriaceae bacterium]|nr:class IIb bacteriocin, lactobin A/cerein 7B family [Flavobacteriaceae bacterium]
MDTENKIKTLSNKELKSINGGTLAYDIGWAIYWGMVSAGAGTMGTGSFARANAMIAYNAHYSK